MRPNKKSIASLLIALTLFVGAALLFLIAFLSGFTAILPLMAGRSVEAQGTIFGVSFGFEALVLFAAAYFCFQKYLERPQADNPTQIRLTTWQIAGIILGTGLSLVIGYFIAENKFINWFVLPVLTIPAVLLPIVLLVALSARQVQIGPRWRVWGVLGLGMTLVPLILLIVEITAIILIIVAIAIWLAAQPGFSTEMMRFANQIDSLQNNQKAILNLITPYILKPGVIISAVLFIGVIVPCTEELVKPLGVWFFAGRLESPAQGFALGALSGAAYALIETFGSSGQTDIWAGLLFSRIGTGLLHITTTGLMGWGIALAWQQRQYLKFFLIYLGSTSLHGIWNTSVILYSLSNLAGQSSPPNSLSQLGPYMLAISIVLAMGLLAILLITNRRLTQTDASNKTGTGGNITP